MKNKEKLDGEDKTRRIGRQPNWGSLEQNGGPKGATLQLDSFHTSYTEEGKNSW